jgi:hypothetical protein
MKTILNNKHMNMIKKIFLLSTVLATLNLSYAQDDEIDSGPDKIKVEAAVVRWADSVFYKHSEYKFENFHAEYSDGYYIAVMRAKAYKERVTDLENDKATGRYKGTEDAYNKEHQSLTDAYQQAQTAADNYVERADYYMIHFSKKILAKKRKELLPKKANDSKPGKVTKTDPNKKVIETRLKKIDSELASLEKQKEKLKSEKAELTKHLRKLK